MIRLRIENAYYDAGPVVSDFSLEVDTAETVAIVGQSGAGKSTVLKIIAGLHTNYTGTLHMQSRRLAFIPQNNGLLPWKTVYGNIVLLASAERRAERGAALRLIEALGLKGLETRYPHSLSGGQYKRVALGQAFFYEPDVILMDEPFSALDGDIKREVQELFMRLQREKGITTVFVTHDIEETVCMGSRVVRLGRA